APTTNGEPDSTVSCRKRPATPALHPKMATTSNQMVSNDQENDGRRLIHPPQLVLRETSLTPHTVITRKRLRSADAENDKDNDATLVYSLDDIADGTQHDPPYTVVTHRKNRTTSIPDDGIIEERPSKTVVLTFRTDRVLREHSYLAFNSHPVEEYLWTR
ncbi:hypothetical protein HPB47_023804, partial [Ixodes persulcatus]